MKSMDSELFERFSEKDAVLIQSHLNVLQQKEISIAAYDFNRPWGGFVLVDEKDAVVFARTFFKSLDFEETFLKNKLSPKLLFVKSKARLSWQYHHRRSEVWQVLAGPVGIVKSSTDVETPLRIYQKGESVRLMQGERHRLVGLDTLGAVAEFWQHTHPQNPSNEEDIVRLQDDYLRT